MDLPSREHDGLVSGVEFPGNQGNAGAGYKKIKCRPPLLATKTARPAGMPASVRGKAQTGPGVLHEEIAFGFRRRINHLHGELTRRAGDTDTAERHAENPDSGRTKVRDRGRNIHRVASEAVVLVDDQDISGLEPAGEPCGSQPLTEGGASVPLRAAAFLLPKISNIRRSDLATERVAKNGNKRRYA